MGSEEFIQKAKEYVRAYAEAVTIHPENFTVYVVWSCYILGNQKALLSTTLHDKRYYEVTYDSNKKVFYFDSYVKEYNERIES